ncbi:MAG TPA: hypothetical protein VMN57_14990 [Anaerolineales bacterium]|nr:hypothetical protein [Anaerolineales bacterium]
MDRRLRGPSGAGLEGQRPPRIAILLPVVWGIRNVVHSGVLESLAAAGVEVTLLVKDLDPGSPLGGPVQAAADPVQAPGDPVQAPADPVQGPGYQRLVPPDRVRPVWGRSFLNAVLTSAFSRRNRIRSYDIYRKWYGRNAAPAERARRAAVELSGFLAQPGFVFNRLARLYGSIYRFEHDFDAIRTQLRAIEPDLLWSTVNVDPVFERAYFETARALGIRIANSVLSFDNLTSKPVHLVYDHYFVWAERMKAELLRLFPEIDPAAVEVTGTPQFDFHRRPAFLRGRPETLLELGLPPDGMYFLYACSHRSLAPDEPELVAALARRMRAYPALAGCRLVVRTHPLDDWGRWAQVAGQEEAVTMSNAWSVEPDEDGWAPVGAGEQVRLVSTLKHAAACLNIASTTSLDAAILDRPVIGIRFEGEPDAPRGILYAEYEADHYAPLVRSGGLRIANSWDELLSLMGRALVDPQRDAAGRGRMVAEECGQVDGRAAERVTAGLLRQVEIAGRG